MSLSRSLLSAFSGLSLRSSASVAGSTACVAGPSRLGLRSFSSTPVASATINQGSSFKTTGSQSLSHLIRPEPKQSLVEPERGSPNSPKLPSSNNLSKRKPSAPKYTRRNPRSPIRPSAKSLESSSVPERRRSRISREKDIICRNIAWSWFEVEGPRICLVSGKPDHWYRYSPMAAYPLVLCYRYKLVRGALDFSGVANRTASRSKYGGQSPLAFLPSCDLKSSG